MKKDLIILFSGGADSVALSLLAQERERKPFYLMFDYGQKMIKEIWVGKKYLDSIGGDFTVIGFSFPVKSVLTGQEVIYEDVPREYVPFRNTIFISFAASIAESMGIKEIWIGANLDDSGRGFPDCCPKYFREMDRVLEVGGSNRVVVNTPLITWSKEMVWNFLKEHGIKREQVYSGYDDNASS